MKKEIKEVVKEFNDLKSKLIKNISSYQKTAYPSSEMQEDLMGIFKEVLEYSWDNDILWEYCRFETFKINIEKSLNTKKDDSHIDYLNLEIENLKGQLGSKNKSSETFGINDYWLKIFKRTIYLQEFADDDIYKIIDADFKLKLSFLEKKLKSYEKTENINLNTPETIITQLPLKGDIDLSGNYNAAKKVVYLHKLGIINFLRTKYPDQSINKLASVISSFTGIKQKTLQPYLNALINSPETHTDNNILFKTALLDEVEKMLKTLDIYEQL